METQELLLVTGRKDLQCRGECLLGRRAPWLFCYVTVHPKPFNIYKNIRFILVVISVL